MAQKIYTMSEQYEEYLIDESKYTGYADSISFPETEEEVASILAELREGQIPVTIQGGKTGIVGGAVPKGGHVMNLSHMNQVMDSGVNEDGTGWIRVQPGINLIDLRKEVGNRFRKQALFWPPDPTETSASIGGIAAAGAQGISRILYGRSESYIESLKLIDYQGNVSVISRGETVELNSGDTLDALEAVLGKEGITGIITELTLRLIAKPEELWGIAFFFEDKAGTGAFVDQLKENLPKAETASIAAVEYIDRKTLDLIEGRKSTMTKIKELPDVGEEIQAMVYVEIHGQEEGIEEVAELLMELAMECGSDPDEAWAVSGEADVEKLHAFRHGAAETANLYIEERHREDPRITKLGMDMILDGQAFSGTLESYEESLKASGLDGCIFGHALENHLHMNLLPADYEEYERGIELIRTLVAHAAEEHGKVVGEHGVGKLKKEILGELIPSDYVELCRALRQTYDPDIMFARDNVCNLDGVIDQGSVG